MKPVALENGRPEIEEIAERERERVREIEGGSIVFATVKSNAVFGVTEGTPEARPLCMHVKGVWFVTEPR